MEAMDGVEKEKRPYPLVKVVAFAPESVKILTLS
jgi:hypothetical protein